MTKSLSGMDHGKIEQLKVANELLIERINKLQADNSDMIAALTKLQRVTAIDNSFNGPDNGEVG